MRRIEGVSRPRLGAFAVLAAASFIAVVYINSVGERNQHNIELLSPLEVGRYAVRAERQSADYDQKAERQIAFATDNDNAATGERDLAAKEEKRARDSAYLAADMKATIDKLLEEGRDQVITSELAVFCWDLYLFLCMSPIIGFIVSEDNTLFMKFRNIFLKNSNAVP
jgi:hypothetical protein